MKPVSYLGSLIILESLSLDLHCCVCFDQRRISWLRVLSASFSREDRASFLPDCELKVSICVMRDKIWVA